GDGPQLGAGHAHQLEHLVQLRLDGCHFPAQRGDHLLDVGPLSGVILGVDDGFEVYLSDEVEDGRLEVLVLPAGGRAAEAAPGGVADEVGASPLGAPLVLEPDAASTVAAG